MPFRDAVAVRLEQHARRFLEEQGVAFGPLEHQGPLGGRLVVRQQLVGQGSALVFGERSELDRRGSRVAAAPRGAVFEQLEPRRAHDQRRNVA